MLSIVLPLDLTTLMRCLPRIHFQWIGCSCSILSARAGCPLPNSSDLIFVIFIVVLEVSWWTKIPGPSRFPWWRWFFTYHLLLTKALVLVASLHEEKKRSTGDWLDFAP